MERRGPRGTDTTTRPLAAHRAAPLGPRPLRSFYGTVAPRLMPSPGGTLDVTDVYVREFWLAALGPRAIADLLRLAAAAKKGGAIPKPRQLPNLIRARLVFCRDGQLLVVDRVPVLPPHLVERLPLPLRRRHPAALTQARRRN